MAARGWIFALCALAAPTTGVFMDLAGGEARCIGEEMEEESYGKFTFGVKFAPGAEPSKGEIHQSNVQVTVTDPSRRSIFSARLDFDAPDVFAFSTKRAGLHKVCFSNRGRKGAPGTERRVLLDVKADIEAKDYSEVIRKEHLRPLELEFFKAEDALKQVAREFNYMRKREARMRETSESTGGRIKMFGYVSISVLLLLSFWQTVYLKSFFRSKKLL